jgi:hypothetical protein
VEGVQLAVRVAATVAGGVLLTWLIARQISHHEPESASLTTMTTVGYGDIHATGQAGRVVVAVQLVFNVAVIATSASLLTRQLRVRGLAKHAGPPPGDHPQSHG